MAVSLGARISGLLIAGALAIATAAACGGVGDGDGAAGGPGGGGTSISGGGAGDGGASGAGGPAADTPMWRPDGGDGEVGATDGATGGMTGGTTGGSEGANRAGRSGSSGGNGDSTGGGGHVEAPGWLPRGPKSPDGDRTADPESVYDALGEHPEKCGVTAGLIPAEPPDDDWRAVRALAEACKAVQGQGGDWDTAAADYAALRGRLTGCKGRAAYAVLGEVLRFHRQHPSTTVRLTPSEADGGDVCDFRVVAVDVGGDGEATPGDTITVRVGGIYFDKRELLSATGAVTIAGVPAQPAAQQDHGAEPRDQLTFVVVVPVPPTVTYPQSADVSVTYGGTAALEGAFTLVAPGTTDSASPSPVESSGTPSSSIPSP
ncbi:hypothetical protein [Streptomyces blattellae]|uniref:hypothetical protein n=1 Tax=Streptomyces blattellae TaxID=2569855 RepID=UPI0018ACDF36|nr:hypothetical protein [Streptomyces blattellae]